MGCLAAGFIHQDYFDLICAFQIFDHLTDPRRVLKRLPGVFETPRGSCFLILHDSVLGLQRSWGRNCPIVDIEHPFLYKPKTIIKMLEANGFTVQKKFSVLNRYPLRYWMQLMPFPRD